jgi:hypothetical protein
MTNVGLVVTSKFENLLVPGRIASERQLYCPGVGFLRTDVGPFYPAGRDFP